MSALEPPDAPVPFPAPPPEPDDAAAASDVPTVDPRRDERSDVEVTADLTDETRAVYPPVVAVVVTRNPGPWLDETLGGLAAQDYADLTVLVVDCGSDDDPTPRVASTLPRAFVRRLDATAGFAEAANEALRVVEGSMFLLLCHDDVVLDETATRLLVEEGYRSNAGILGPKLVSADNPEILLEVGRAIDRFGAPYIGIEPGELDQEQHDGVRDVFYVTSAAMLVRTDLFTELGGFDPATFPGAEDLDLCWRARLAGARVIVAPDARASHRLAADERGHGDRPDESALARSRVRVLLTSYSWPRLLWLVPFGMVVAGIEAVGDLVTGRPRRARAAIGAWFSNLFHLRRLRPARRQAQALRRVHDSELRDLQVSSTTRLSAFLAHHLQTEGRIRDIGDASRNAVGSISDGMRTPAAIAFLGFFVVVAVGSRSLLTQGVPAIGTFATWPAVGDLFNAFGSVWRYTGLGSVSAAPPALVLSGGLGSVLLGSVGLARTLVVVLALPVGAVCAYRLALRVIGLRGPALAAGLAYGVNPVARNAIAQGRLGPLVFFAMLPFLLNRVLRLAEGSDVRRGRFVRLAVLTAVLGAWYPAGLGLFALAAATLVVAIPLARGAKLALRALAITIGAVVVAVVLLFPWPLAYTSIGGDRAALGFAFRPDLDLSDVLRFHTGPSGAGWAMWGLVVAAAVPLFVATGDRLAWTARAWLLALVGWAVVWVPSRFFPNTSVLAPEAGLTLAALGLALALGIAVSVLVDGIRTFRFGWRQPAAILGGVAILLPMLAFAADAADGRWHAPETDWTSTLAFTQSLTEQGEFRMLWVGDPTVLPLDPVVLADGTGYTLTRNGPGNVIEQWRATEHTADHAVDHALQLAEADLTTRLGKLLAPMGVRYVVMPSIQGAGGGAVAPPSRRLQDGLAQQLDLAQLRAAPGLVLYENEAYAPIRAVVSGRAASVPTGRVDPSRAALDADLSGAKPVGDAPVTAGRVLWGEAFDADWRASAAGRSLRHQETFGWANGFVLPRRARVSITESAQWQRWALLGASLLIWLAVAWRWWRTRARRDPAASTRSTARRERSARYDPLTEVLDEDAFWWERV
jgi:GT2 family glycosyltransferase